MKLTKKQLCAILAVVVTLCFLTALISTILTVRAAVTGGGEIPAGTILLTLLTAFCTLILWRGVGSMD